LKIITNLPLLYLCADVGDFVKADEIVARIETDKVTVDILSKHTGTIKQYFAAEGDSVVVGAQLMEIDTDGQASAGGATP
jgi:2-oxoglutarate dehydrogenase E2 component (dihydrolipoamide succinyltransferase)